MEKKAISGSDDQKKKETEEAAEKAANAGLVNRLFVHFGQKVGIVEWTKLEPRFERNINKLISYHNIIYNIVDGIEMQVQLNPEVLATRKVVSPEGENPWEMIGGWLHYMSLTQFEGNEAVICQKYSYAFGKIAQKETQMQKRTRSHLIRKMRVFTGDGSYELNEAVGKLATLLRGVDNARHTLKSAQTTTDLKLRGEEYRTMIRAFNEAAYEIQGWIDEVSILVTLHQNELLKFCKELSQLHNDIYNEISIVVHRFGHKIKLK